MYHFRQDTAASPLWHLRSLQVDLFSCGLFWETPRIKIWWSINIQQSLIYVSCCYLRPWLHCDWVKKRIVDILKVEMFQDTMHRPCCVCVILFAIVYLHSLWKNLLVWKYLKERALCIFVPVYYYVFQRKFWRNKVVGLCIYVFRNSLTVQVL